MVWLAMPAIVSTLAGTADALSIGAVQPKPNTPMALPPGSRSG